jgi:hypothetical protein
VIGTYVLCHYIGFYPNIIFNKEYQEFFEWGSNKYDIRLFEPIEAFTKNIDGCDYYIHAPNPSSSLSPYKVYELINKHKQISFYEVSQKYKEYAKKLIQPSSIIKINLPHILKNAYGIHLRKTDKIKSANCDIRHENKIDEFTIIIEHLLENIKEIIEKEENPTFLVVSEDDAWKKSMIDTIKEMSYKNIHIVELDYYQNDYSNYNSVLDMFALSQCKTIIQGVKYSSYSILAALIGCQKVVNYSRVLESNSESLIYTWNSVIEINGEYIENPDIFSYMTKTIQNPAIYPTK